jgi:hypothetical protein
MIPSVFVIILVVPAFLFAQVREVVEARPIPRPLTLAPIVGLRFGTRTRIVAVTLFGVAEKDVELLRGSKVVLVSRFSRERAAHLFVLGRHFVGLRLRVEVVVGDVHIVRIWDVEVNGKEFLCGHADAKDQFDLSTICVLVAGQVAREHFAVEVEARERVRVSPTQAIGQAEVDELLNLVIRRRRVGRPRERGDNLASLDADEIVPELDAVTIVVLRDDERAEGSVDVELGFFIFHGYRIAQRTKNTRIFLR